MCRQTFTVPSALAVIISPASVGWCSVHVITLTCTLGSGIGCMGLACYYSTSDPTYRQSREKRPTSSKSQAQTNPPSSPQTTLASACPKHARHRYEEFAWPEKELRSLPVDMSISRMVESSVATRMVCSSIEGTIDVIGSNGNQTYGKLRDIGTPLTADIVGTQFTLAEVIRANVAVDRASDYACRTNVKSLHGISSLVEDLNSLT